MPTISRFASLIAGYDTEDGKEGDGHENMFLDDDDD
jgi:hypothetical protein